MSATIASANAHPQGECVHSPVPPHDIHSVDTPGGRFTIEFDDTLSATPSGSLVGFAQFLRASGLWGRLCANAPFAFTSNNAPEVADILGTALLGILSGASRFAHLDAVRFDPLAPEVLGLGKICSEDSVRRAFNALDPAKADAWLTGELAEAARPLVASAPWVLDIDVTVKPLYGRGQDGGVVSYNPAKPGRPARVHHTFLMSGTRLVLDTDVRAGDEHAALHGLGRARTLLRTLPEDSRPRLVRGDCAYGTLRWMQAMDALNQPYLFKVRLSKNAAKLARAEPAPDEPAWQPDERGWECRETLLRCESWPEPRRVIVQRRLRTDAQLARARKNRKQRAAELKKELPLLAYAGELETIESPESDLRYEHAVLASNLHGWPPPALCRLYRDRADSENPFDELKNQWGWSGFSVRELGPSGTLARFVALVYDWWSLYTRLALPGRHNEALTSRPKLLGGVTRKTTHAGQRHLSIKLMHAASATTKAGVLAAIILLNSYLTGPTARQLEQPERWGRIGAKIAAQILAERREKDTPPLPPPPARIASTG